MNVDLFLTLTFMEAANSTAKRDQEYDDHELTKYHDLADQAKRERA